MRFHFRFVGVRIEDYGLIGDTHTAALVGRNGSIEWLCLPYFDSPACFAALLGTEENGCWKMTPVEEIIAIRRRYRDDTLILETEFETASGCVRLIDFMPLRQGNPALVRIVEGVKGKVKMRMKLVVRFDYGSVIPWVHRVDDRLEAIAGPDALSFWPGVETRGENLTTVSDFTVAKNERVPFVLLWHRSHELPQKKRDAEQDLAATERWWREWSRRTQCTGEWKEPMHRALITLKALTFAPTGGIVAAATSSLPEKIGGIRNWDYRYCWLRDATLAFFALVDAGYKEEASAWRDWLLRAVAGTSSHLQVMYGIRGERRLPEFEIPWLAGYEGSKPVHAGNTAYEQFQLDVYGEVMDVMHEARRADMEPAPHAWQIQCALAEFLEDAWRRADHGIWEMRGPRRHFTHSKVMAWVGFDRAVKSAEQFGLAGPVDRWRSMRDRIHAEVCEKGFSRRKNSFVQEFGSEHLDASLLALPLVGFLPHHDERVSGTIRAIEQELLWDGFVLRYDTASSSHVDALPSGEGSFLLCNFWLADNYSLAGRRAEAREMFERLLSIRNDLGLLSEEYDPKARRLLGNFPQAFSHVGLINTARNLSHPRGPAHARSRST
jgi:GH15 family glucan-1,4-alpha-glucosidase